MIDWIMSNKARAMDVVGLAFVVAWTWMWCEISRHLMLQYVPNPAAPTKLILDPSLASYRWVARLALITVDVSAAYVVCLRILDYYTPEDWLANALKGGLVGIIVAVLIASVAYLLGIS